MLDKLNEPNKSDLLEFIKRIRKIGKFMLSLVNDLLDIANIESGQLELNLSEQDLRIVIREVINMNSIFAQAKSMEIIFEEPGLPVMLLIDRPKIEQVITNLLSNAIKYSFPGSAIFLRLENEGSMARVSVKDQGQGIREEELQKLFKPFQKTSTKSTAGEKSTGLGLLIVKKIVEAHHGEIGVTSKFEEGSVFFFKLPIPDESRIAKVYS